MTLELGAGGFLQAAASLLLTFSILCLTAQSQEVPKDATQPAQQTPASATIPSYPDTAQGLEKLMKDMMKLTKNDNHNELAAYARSFMLPDAESWFKSVFGEKLGAQLAVASERARSEIELSGPDLILRAMREKLANIHAVRFDEECNPLATDAEYTFLVLRVRPESLYDVRFHDSTRQLIWAYFAYVDGGFRFIGNLTVKASGSKYTPGEAHPPAGTLGPVPNPQRIRVAGKVQAAKLLPSCQVLPRYPDEAKSKHIQGTVILHAIIGTDGEVNNLELVEGPPALVQTSMDAVKRWRYRPTLLNGEPVEVDTTISVVFTLGG
jgi:TonB family protein